MTDKEALVALQREVKRIDQQSERAAKRALVAIDALNRRIEKLEAVIRRAGIAI